MAYADPEVRRIKDKEYKARTKARRLEEKRSLAPHLNCVTTIGKRAAAEKAKREAFTKSGKAGAQKGARASALLAYIPAPITLAPVGGPTLEEIEAKYGRI